MARSLLQNFTLLALVTAIVFVGHNFVTYVLRVNGGYSQWTVFTKCTKTCGQGTRFRSRNCNNPVPRFGGLNCSILGDDVQTVKCNTQPCPVDGGYSEWTKFSECSVSCGGGKQERTRECTNPKPENGGHDCEELGPSSATKECNTAACPKPTPVENKGEKQNKENKEKKEEPKKEEAKKEEAKKDAKIESAKKDEADAQGKKDEKQK